jgi:hypothetical protein
MENLQLYSLTLKAQFVLTLCWWPEPAVICT